MVTLIRYAISIAIWAAVAIIMLFAGKIVYLMFWTLLGLALILFWLGHMLYHFFYLFNPDFKPIKIVIFMMVILAGGLIYFKVMLEPKWNRWGSTEEEIEAKYKVDEFCPDAELRTVRTVEVDVPRDYIFKWVRQLPEVGSYGQSLIFDRGNEQFQKLLDNLPQLKEGDEFLIGKIVDYDEGKSITFDIGSDPKFPKMGIKCMYGGYYFKQIDDDKTRISSVIRAEYDGFPGWFYSQLIIEIGDFFITSKQLSKLKQIAESQFSHKNE